MAKVRTSFSRYIFFADWSRLSCSISLYLAPSILTRCPVPAEEEHPHCMRLPPPHFTVGMVFVKVWAVLGLHHTWHLEFWQKSCMLVSSDHKTMSPCFLANSKCALLLFLYCHPHIQASLYRTLGMIVWCTFTPLSATELCSSLVSLWLPSQVSLLRSRGLRVGLT